MDVQIDDVMPDGAPDTVTLPVTKHVLSLPHPEKGEMFASYAWRVHRQCGWPDAADCRGEIMFNTGAICDPAGGWTPDGLHWPLATDMFFNHDAYLTPEQRQQLEVAKAQWAKALANIGQQGAAQPAKRPHKHGAAGLGGASAQAGTGTVTPAVTPGSGDGPPISQG